MLLKNGFLSAALLYLGVLLANIQTYTPNWLVQDNQWFVIGYILMSIGGLMGIHFILSLWRGVSLNDTSESAGSQVFVQIRSLDLG